MDKIALITGGAQGIGAAAARMLLQNGYAGVVLLDRNVERLRLEAKALSAFGQVEIISGDLRDDATPMRAVDFTLSTFGRLDVLINAAGNTARGSVGEIDLATYAALFDVNVKAPLFLMQAAAKAMKNTGGGTIINISSMIAYGGLPSLATYSASKAALNALTKHAAQEFAFDGIRSFAIALGWALTEGERQMQASLGMPHDWAEKYGADMPSGRLIAPEDIADLICYLVSPSAAMMNGAIIDFEQMPQGMFRLHPALKTSA